MTLRIGCIGGGFIAARHLENLGGMEGVSVVGVADVAAERARERAARHGACAYTDWRAMLEQEQPHAVYLCLPPFARGEPEQALVEAGVPFFVEKPLSLSPEWPEQLARQISARGLLTPTGYHWRYIDTLERARERLAVHPPHLALGYWLDFVPPPPWWTCRAHSGGQVLEQTTHIIDLARYLVGEVTHVFGAACASGLEHHPGSDIDAASVATLQFASAAVGVISSTCLAHYPHRIGLWLYAQDLIVECCERSLAVETPAGRETFLPQTDPYLAEDRAFVHALRTGDPSVIRVPYAEALRTHRLTMRIVESARERRPLALTKEADRPCTDGHVREGEARGA
jgi:predicted dehydrogenase